MMVSKSSVKIEENINPLNDSIVDKKSTYFLINNNKLIEFKTPDCQRAILDEQVNEMLDYQLKHYKKYNEFFFPNPIIIAKLKDHLYILDGQHRIACINQLSQLEYNFDIPVTLLNIFDERELDDKYIAINKNRPVPLPSNITDWKQFGRYIDQYFQNNFSVYFSNSDKPNAPNFNKELLMKYINDNKIAAQIECNYQLFIKELLKLNIPCV